MGLFARHAIGEKDTIGYYTGEVIIRKRISRPRTPLFCLRDVDYQRPYSRR